MKPTLPGPGRAALLALALGAPVAPAGAQEADVAAAKRPESTVSVGGIAASGDPHDRTIFGQYNGLREHSGNLLLDLDYVDRDDQTGVWTIVRGRNLGLDSRDLGLSVQKQGDWRIGLDYSELVHHEIRTINTGLVGAGTTTPDVVRLGAPGTGNDVDLSLKRTAIGVSGDKWISRSTQLEVSFRNEDKDGSRLWARGYDCASYVCTGTQNATNTRWALLLLPEPVNFNMKQAEVKFNFTGDKLFVSAGYYGSFFTNANGTVDPTVPNQLNGAVGQLATLNPAVAGGTSLQNVLQLPLALYPDNQAHQFYVSGNYAFTPSTHSTFKLAYTHATQDDDFASKGLSGAPAGRTSLDGVLDTTLAQLGLTAHPAPKVSLVADLRYVKRDDKTPIAPYNIENTVIWDNSHISSERVAGKLEASYLFAGATRATFGVDYDQLTKELPGLDVVVEGLSALRGRTQEVTYRAELRRSVSETLIGSIGFAHSDRTGSDWYNLCTSAACVAQGLTTYGGLYTYDQIYQRTGTFPFDVSDRRRDKLRATADWTATDQLSLQFVAEGGNDIYNPPSQNGLQTGSMGLFSVDLAYALSDRWKLTAYASYGLQKVGEADRSNYVSETTNRNSALGFGVAGRLSAAVDVGGNLTYARDDTEYALSPDQASTPANVAQNAVGLPNVKFTTARVDLFGRYALDRKSDLRLDVMYSLNKLEEWSWNANGIPFTYSDNSTVTINPDQRVTLVGLTYLYRF